MNIARTTSPLCLLLVAACPAIALSAPAGLGDCAAIAANDQRLACFDQLAAPYRSQASPDAAAVKSGDGEPPSQVGSSHAPASLVSTAPVPARPVIKSALAEHWELGPEHKRGTFQFRPHQANYLITTFTDTPNDAPYQPFRRFLSSSPGFSHNELSYQIGFKMKVLEEPLQSSTDLWVSYTQRSFWQARNRDASSPFRETNYEPEVMAVTPLNFSFLGVRARFINLGWVHQSNGQASTLSRSWNRVYAQMGVEKGNFSLVGRVWRRLGEPAAEDDNRDITDYLGRGDLTGTYLWRGHEFSLMTRYNPRTRKGAAQGGWAFPVAGKVKGYVQLFSGYGHSLIDYNHKQNTLGLGFLATY